MIILSISFSIQLRLKTLFNKWTNTLANNVNNNNIEKIN